MIIANFKNDSYPIAHGATQWNYGEVLRIQGLILPKAVEIHFSLDRTCGQSVTRIGTTKDGVTDVVIPDSLLENEGALQDYFIYVWVYVTDGSSGRTEHKLKIKVEARSKPEIPGGDDNADPFREAVEAVNSAAERAESAEQKATEHAEQTKADAQQTTADRREVEKLVDSVSGIGEQVEAAKDYSEQAKTAATNALQSEQASEQAKESALQAQAGAETAADEAEQHALEVAGDKAEVERMATQVRQDKTAVEQTKMAVDKTAQDFTLAAQQAVADVNNAGQSQTEYVQQTGQTAVENVQDARTQAVNAINTTKEESVKAVQTEGTTQTGNVTAEGEKQLQAVQNVAQEIIADREQIKKNATDIAELRQTKADAIVESASGTLLNIKDSSGAFFEDFSMLGKTEQVNTTGANLFDDKQLLDETNPNYDKSLQNTGIWWFKIPVSSTVTVSLKNGKQKANYYLVASDKKGWNTGGVSHWFVHPMVQLKDSATITPIDGCIWLGVNTSISSIKSMLYIVGGIMINEGTETKPYEQYTGGKPAPAPDNLSPIVSAGENGNIKVAVTGKNLIPFPYPKLGGVGTTGIDNGITYTVLKDRGIKLTGKALKDVYVNVLQNFEMTDNKKYVCSNNLKADPNNGFIHYYVGEGQSIDKTYYPQVEIGTIPTAYEPYREPQEVQLQLDKPMTKWDRLEKRDGIWGIARQGDRKILDGTESWYLYTGYKNDTLRCYCVDSIKAENGLQKSLCSHFKNINNAWFNEIGKCGYYSDHDNLQNKYFISDKQTVDDFKAWLVQQKEAGTPVELVYKTQTETWEPLPEETQLALNNLHTNYPTTIISNSEDCDMEVEYIADTKNYIDKQMQAIVTKQTETDRLILERTM